MTTTNAGDTVITLVKLSAEIFLGQANTIMHKTKQYCTNKLLPLNKSKTVQIIFTTKNQNIKFTRSWNLNTKRK